MTEPDPDYPTHFLELAKKGAHPAASGREKRAARLCEAVLDNVTGLDAQAVADLHRWIDLVQKMPGTAREIVDEWN